MKNFYITTAIDYTNGPPHIGHAYEKILADVIARYQRLAGREVYFLTGVDQHGQKVQQAAEREGIAPQDFADGVTARFVALWEKLEVRYDGWAATTDPRHKASVQRILQRLHDEGQLYKGKHAGFYSVRQEQFLTDKERGPDGSFGPEWGEVVEIEEENWYFKLAEHKEWLQRLVEARPEIVVPGFRRTELQNALERLGGDLSISRPKQRLAWGIELPFDPDYVTYVWFDALINYISFAGYGAEPEAGLPDFKKLWPCDAHVIGKDILIPAHGVYWLIMLHAMGFMDEQIPPVLVHGYINIAGGKMSKSLGNIIDPDALADKYGAEALRYYLIRDCATGQDMEFSEERLQQRYNADLANDLGNLLNRTLNMTGRYRSDGLKKTAVPERLATLTAGVLEVYPQKMAQYQIHAALESVWSLVGECNSFIEAEAPWKLAKDPANEERLDAVLYGLAETMRIVAILVSPVLPRAAAAILEQLGVQQPMLLSQVSESLPDGHAVGKAVPLFPRLEIAK